METPCKIRIVKPLDGVYPLYQPEVGKVYDATYYPEQRTKTKRKDIMVRACVALDIAGKKIVVRQDEYEMIGAVKHGGT